MSVFARTGVPSRPGPYWITAIKDGKPHSLTGRIVYYVCDSAQFNVTGLLCRTIGEAESLRSDCEQGGENG